MTFDPLIFAGLLLSGAVALLGPVVAGLLVWRTLRPWWPAVLIGVGTFIASQVVTRIPLVLALTPWATERSKASEAFALGWVVVLSFTAGLFEETGRWLAFRFIPQLRTGRTAVFFGIGHGGIESVLLVGINLVVTAGLYYLLAHGQSVPLPIPEDQLAVLKAQLGTLTPALSVAGGVERVWAMLLHVSLSVVVLQAFVRKQRRWLFFAMGYHGVANLSGLLATRRFGPFVGEAVIGVVSVAALAWAVTQVRREAPGGAAPQPATPAA